MTDQNREAGTIITHLHRALLDGSRDLRLVPGLLARILREEMWRRQWNDPKSGRPFGPFKSFAEFVQKPVSEGGLGSNERQLRGLCAEDADAERMLRDALKGKAGRPGPLTKSTDNNRRFSDGDTRSYALDRLYRQRRDLYDRVVAGEQSPHSAMVEAGFRRRTMTVPMDADALAAALRRRLDHHQLDLLIKALERDTP